MAVATRGLYAAVVLLLLALLAEGIPVAEHKIEKRNVPRMVQFVAGGFSTCVGNCDDPNTPAGIRTQSVVCQDQDRVRYLSCTSPNADPDNCCAGSFIFDTFEACNPNCGGTNNPDFPVGSFVLNNADGSVSNVTITRTMPNANTIETVVMLATREVDGGTATVTVSETRIGGLLASRSGSGAARLPPGDLFRIETTGSPIPLFPISETTFYINNVSILIPPESNFVRATSRNDTVSYSSSIVTLSNPSVAASAAENAQTYYYISPLGLSYRFDGNKIADDVGEGLLFVNMGRTVAIFSQSQVVSNLLQSSFVAAHRIVIDNSELQFRIGLVQAFVLNNALRLSTGGEPLRYDNGLFTSGGGTVAASNVFILGSTGFEAYDNDSTTANQPGTTFISEYDAAFYDPVGQRVLVSTDASLSSQVQQGINYVAGNNPLQPGVFTLDGNTIEYQGVEVLELSPSTQTTMFSTADSLFYSGNQLSLESTGQVVATGVEELFVQEDNGLVTAFGRTFFDIQVTPGSVLYYDNDINTGVVLDSQFNNSITFFSESLDMVLNPPLPTVDPTLMFVLVRQGGQVFLRIGTMNVLEPTASNCQTTDITSSDTVTFNNGVITLQSAGIVIPNVQMLTVATTASNVILPGTTTGYSIDVDSAFLLEVCGSNAVLTNVLSVQTLIDNAPNQIGIVEVNNQRTLFVGSEQVLPLNSMVDVFPLSTAGHSLRFRSGNLITISVAGVGTLLSLSPVTLDTFLAIDGELRRVGVGDGFIEQGPGGVVYGIEADRTYFYTDVPVLIDTLDNELASRFFNETTPSGQTILRTNASDVIVLNGVEQVAISGDQTFQYLPGSNRVNILDSSDNSVDRFFTGVNRVSSFFLESGSGEPVILQSMFMRDGPLRLYAQNRLGNYFVTDNPILLSTLDAGLPIPSLLVTAVDGGSNNVLLSVGDALSLSITEQVQISPGAPVTYMNSILVFDSQTVPNINTLFVYLTSDGMPQMFTTSSPSSILGPGYLYYNDNQALFTDRPDITTPVNAINPVPPPQAPAVTIRTEPDGRVALIIGGDRIISLNERPIISVMGQTVRFTGSSIEIVNPADNSVIQTLPGIMSFTSYREDDTASGPQTTTSSTMITGANGRLIYTSNTAFFTDRTDVINSIDMNPIPEFPARAVTVRTEPDGRVSLVIGGDRIISLNERPMIPLTGETVRFTGSSVEIVDPADNSVIQTLPGITSFTSYTEDDTVDGPQTTTSSTTIAGANGRLIYTSNMAFFANRTDVLNSIDMRTINLLVRVTNGFLEVAGENRIQLVDSVRLDILEGQEAMISGSTLTVRDTASGSILTTFTGNIVRYLTTDSAPVTNPGNMTIPGPATLVIDEDMGNAFITDRSEVITQISTVLATGNMFPTLPLSLGEGENGTTNFFVNMVELFMVDRGVIREVSDRDRVTFNGMNTVTITNLASGMQNDLTAVRFIQYFATDGTFRTFDSTSASVDGPLFLFYQPNQSPSTVFVTNRMDVERFLMEALTNVTLLATPAPVTPLPPTAQPPEPVDIINDDGSRWTINGVWSECSRTCGAGIRLRNVVCRFAAGNPSTACDDPGQRSANAVPATVELCNIQECPGETRNGIPRDETITFTDSNTNSRAIVRITNTNVTDRVYKIDLVSYDRQSGSVTRETFENIDGVQSRDVDFDLRTIPVVMMTNIFQMDLQLRVQVNRDTVLIVDPIAGDQCFRVTPDDVVDYRDRTITFGTNVFNDILVLTTLEEIEPGSNEPRSPFLYTYQEELQTIDFGAINIIPRLSFELTQQTQDSVLCVSPRMQSAFIGGLVDPPFAPANNDFADGVINGVNAITNALTVPSILMLAAPPMMDEIVTSGEVVQVGITPVEVREDIFYFSLRCQLSNPGFPPTTEFMWTFEGNEIPNNNVKYSITGDTLLIKNINEADMGNYTCTATNPIGSDEASTEVVVNPRPIPTRPTDPPPTPAPPPDWVTERFSTCSVGCGVGFQVRAVTCRDSNGAQSQMCDQQNVPQLVQLCNTQDCPNGPERNGVPPVNTTEFTYPIFNGDVDITVDVRSSNPTTGDFMLLVTSMYPDDTVIVQQVQRNGNTGMMTVSTMTTYGEELLFGRLESIRNGDRIDIEHLGILFSVLPQIGDVCFNLSSDEQFLYTNGRIIYRPYSFDNIQFLIGAGNEGISSYQQSTSRVFTGPLTLCVSSQHNRAFFTDFPRLADTVHDQYEDIISAFEPPMIQDVNMTTTVADNPFRAVFLDIGENVDAPENTPVYIRARLSDQGNPPVSEFTWTFNGQPLETNPDKGIFFTTGRSTLILNSLLSNNVGTYTATASNPAGSDSSSSTVRIRPNEGIVLENRESMPPTYSVSIGTTHTIDSNQYDSLDVFCDVTTASNETFPDIRFLINGMEADTSDPNVNIALSSRSAILSISSLTDGLAVYMCMATVGNDTFSETSTVTVTAFTQPDMITFTGDRQLNVGETSTITCQGNGNPPSDAMFNEVQLGPNGIVSDFMFSGDTMTINRAVYGDDSMYCCQATNAAGSFEQCTQITLMIPPSIPEPAVPEVPFVPLPLGTTFPLNPAPMINVMVGQDVTVVQGTTVNIRCQASGSPEPTRTWVVNGVADEMEGAGGENYTINAAQPADAGTYECRLLNAAGTATRTTRVTVVSPPVVIPSANDVTELSVPDTVVDIEQDSDLLVLNGLDFCINCAYTPGVPPETTIVWQRNGDNVNFRDACLHFEANRSQLCFESISRPYSDIYTCIVSNIAGSDSGSINVVVAEAPRIAFPTHPSIPAPSDCDSQLNQRFVHEDVGVNLCVNAGARVLIDCVVEGEPKPPATVQWFYNESNPLVFPPSPPPLLQNSSVFTIFPNNSLLIDPLIDDGIDFVLNGGGPYLCRASNFAGRHERVTSITVQGEMPSINGGRLTTSPFQGNRYVINVGSSRQTVNLQRFQEIQILCRAEGNPTPEISWTVNGVDIGEEPELFDIMEDGSLLITGLLNTHCSEYVCRAADFRDRAVSAAVTVCGERFSCLHSGFGECSQTCGVGFRQATFECNRTFDGEPSPIDSSLVLPSIRPNVEPDVCFTGIQCPQRSFQFVATPFSECSQTCGCGRQFRTVKCYSFFGDERQEEVDFAVCSMHAVNKTLPGPLSRDCNDFPCPEWRVGDFSECSQECGSAGNQTRDVFCVAPANNNVTVPDSFCDSNARPVSHQRCNRFTCPYYYVPGPYGECSTTCQGGTRTRTVSCYNAITNQAIDDSFCAREIGVDKRPSTIHVCGTGACPAQFVWRTGAFEECSTTCDYGVRFRSVECIMVSSKSPVNEIMCGGVRRPEATTPCFSGACQTVNGCTSENPICVLVANVGMCSAFRPNCCISCPP